MWSFDEGDAVHVLTYHKAKGLEFSVVYMVGLVADRIPGSRSARRPRAPGRAAPRRRRRTADQHTAEERRLFYVGMTRAREALVADLGAGLRRASLASVSQFVTEALDLPPATPAESVRPALLEQLARHAGSSRERRPLRRRSGPRSATARSRSATARSTTTSTARRGTGIAHVVRIPTPASHQMVYGRALHAAVQAYHRRQLADAHDRWPSCMRPSTPNWESVGFLTREHEEARRAAAHEAIDRFWEAQQRDPARPTAVEQDFTVSFGRDRLRGRYDRVDRDDGGPRRDHRLQVERRPRPRRPPTGAPGSRSSCRSTPWPTRRSTASLPDELALHFLESGIVGRAVPTEKRLAEGAGAADLGRRRHPRRPLRCDAGGHAMWLLPVPRDLPRRVAMSGRHRLTVVAPHPARHPGRSCSSWLSPVAPAPWRPVAQPCPDAARNRVVVVVAGLGGAWRCW